MSVIVLIIFATIFFFFHTSSSKINNGTSLNLSNIFSGGIAQRHQFPYQTSIQEKLYGYTFQHICSGAILKSKWIITTAYCVYNSKYPLRIVAGSLLPNEAHADIQIVTIERIVIHPKYAGGISENDIALLKLKTSLVYSKAVLPISIQLQDIKSIHGAALNSGWNIRSRDLQRPPLQILSYVVAYILPCASCGSALQKAHVSPHKVICTEQVSSGLHCPGESGNTLTYGGYLVGLTSWGVSPCSTTIYTNVSSFTKFIRHYTTVRKRSK